MASCPRRTTVADRRSSSTVAPKARFARSGILRGYLHRQQFALSILQKTGADSRRTAMHTFFHTAFDRGALRQCAPQSRLRSNTQPERLRFVFNDHGGKPAKSSSIAGFLTLFHIKHCPQTRSFAASISAGIAANMRRRALREKCAYGQSIRYLSTRRQTDRNRAVCAAETQRTRSNFSRQRRYTARLAIGACTHTFLYSAPGRTNFSNLVIGACARAFFSFGIRYIHSRHPATLRRPAATKKIMLARLKL